MRTGEKYIFPRLRGGYGSYLFGIFNLLDDYIGRPINSKKSGWNGIIVTTFKDDFYMFPKYKLFAIPSRIMAGNFLDLTLISHDVGHYYLNEGHLDMIVNKYRTPICDSLINRFDLKEQICENILDEVLCDVMGCLISGPIYPKVLSRLHGRYIINTKTKEYESFYSREFTSFSCRMKVCEKISDILVEKHQWNDLLANIAAQGWKKYEKVVELCEIDNEIAHEVLRLFDSDMIDDFIDLLSKTGNLFIPKKCKPEEVITHCNIINEYIGKGFLIKNLIPRYLLASYDISNKGNAQLKEELLPLLYLAKPKRVLSKKHLEEIKEENIVL
jgi:hypothetical protein